METAEDGDRTGARRGTRRAAIWRGRVGEHRGVLVAAAAGIAILTAIGMLAPAGAAFLVALLLAAAVLTDRKPGARPVPAPVGQVASEPETVGAKDIASAVPEPLITLDEHGSVLHANHAAIAAFGALAPGILLTVRFRAPEMQAFLGQLLQDGVVPATIDYVERLPIERLYRVSAAVVGAAPVTYVIFFKDQSETRRIDRMRADFIANASHELRTPLASVAGFIETLRGPARNDERAREQFLQIMQAQTSRMARLIDDLLSLSRLEMKSPAQLAEPVLLAPLLQGVVDALAHLARELDVQLQLGPVDPGLGVLAGRDELVQVFENLIENACKYGHSGGRVEIEVLEQDGEVAVTVRDFGPGIPEEHIPRVTERFYRVDVDTSRAQKGTGLGLSIVKHILTRYKGRLAIKSAVGEGSAFTVHLPASRPMEGPRE